MKSGFKQTLNRNNSRLSSSEALSHKRIDCLWGISVNESKNSFNLNKDMLI